ncbi:MAG: DUF1080 domain-containing protein [Pirellulales bacterium]|nr:DUF1080 domain-containing protein [Pirellulales bacterium]
MRTAIDSTAPLFRFPTPALLAVVVALSTSGLSHPSLGQEKAETAAEKKPSQPEKKDGQAKVKWTPLKGAWKASQFGGDGPVEIKGNSIKVEIGDPMTGVKWEGEIARENYEVELEARRTDGYDFFCGLTFPVGKDHVSFILGGWGGGIVGISSIDGRDASDNQTTSFRNFDDNKWYRVRVRVEPNEIRCWIDDKPAAEHMRKGHEFDIRYEMDPCIPLGLAAFQCDAEYRNLRWRRLSDQEIAAAKKRAEAADDES